MDDAGERRQSGNEGTHLEKSRVGADTSLSARTNEELDGGQPRPLPLLEGALHPKVKWLSIRDEDHAVILIETGLGGGLVEIPGALLVRIVLDARENT